MLYAPLKLYRELLASWIHNSRHIARVLSPFINMYHVILCGIHYCGIAPESWDFDLMKGM